MERVLRPPASRTCTPSVCECLCVRTHIMCVYLHVYACNSTLPSARPRSHGSRRSMTSRHCRRPSTPGLVLFAFRACRKAPISDTGGTIQRDLHCGQGDWSTDSAMPTRIAAQRSANLRCSNKRNDAQDLTFVGNPNTVNIISHGRFFDVWRAPFFIRPAPRR